MKTTILIGLAAMLLPMPASAHDDGDDRLAVIAQLFDGADIVSGPTIVDCKLSGGTETRCFRITVHPVPGERSPGPWCPTKVSDGKEAGGIWIDKGRTYDVDGAFISNLGTFYRDSEWQLFDPATGEVRVTDTAAKCAAAARPDVDPDYRNYCVECLTEYLAADMTMTYTLPLEPVPLKGIFGGATTESTRQAGVALDGAMLDGPAPLDAILDAHTLAPFDDCGGHVNLHAGYHYHAVTDCTGSPALAGEQDGRMIGFALDGNPILAPTAQDGTTPTDLGDCGGHVVDGHYHYHAGKSGSNQILGCFVAERGCASEDPKAVCDAKIKPARRP